MIRKVAVLLVVMTFACVNAFAMCGSCGSQDHASTAKSETQIVKVNNTICPVTGSKVDMKNPVMVEYKGKAYNLCCPACPKEFLSDPEKYSAKVKE